MGPIVTNGPFFDYDTGNLENFICLNTTSTFNTLFPNGSYDPITCYFFLYDVTDSIILGNKTNDQDDVYNLRVYYRNYNNKSDIKFNVNRVISKNNPQQVSVNLPNRYTPSIGTKVIQLKFYDGTDTHIIDEKSYISTYLPYTRIENGCSYSTSEVADYNVILENNVNRYAYYYQVEFSLSPNIKKIYNNTDGLIDYFTLFNVTTDEVLAYINIYPIRNSVIFLFENIVPTKFGDNLLRVMYNDGSSLGNSMFPIFEFWYRPVEVPLGSDGVLTLVPPLRNITVTGIENGTQTETITENTTIMVTRTETITNNGTTIVTRTETITNNGDPIVTITEIPVGNTGNTGNTDTIIRSNICFTCDTPIHTNQGDIPICEIKPGIHTIRNKKIVAVTKTITDDKYLVCFEKDALYPGVPSKKTLVSKNHKIFYKGSFLYAKCFLPMDNVSKMEYRGEFLYNIIMEEHDRMLVNDMICETLDPSNVITKVFTENSSIENYNEQFQSLKNEFTEFCDKSSVL